MIDFSLRKWEGQICLTSFEFKRRLLIPRKSSEILGKEIDYLNSFPVISKLRIKVGCRKTISKTKTGKMNIIRNQS